MKRSALPKAHAPSSAPDLQPLAPPDESPRLRILARLCTVVGVLALVAAWRLDQAVGTAYRTDWVAPQFVDPQQNVLFGCSGCWRLPSQWWLLAYSLTGTAALVLLLSAVLLFIVGHQRSETRDDIRMLAVVGAVAVVLVAVAAAILRWLGASGQGEGLIAAASALDLLALGTLAIILVAAAMGLRSTEKSPYTLVGRVARFVYRQRVSVVALGLLAVALMFLAQTSGQAVDSIRTWGLGSAHSIARLGFGIAGTLLLSLVVYESGVQLTQVTQRPRKLRDFHRRRWFVGGGVLVAGGVVLVACGPFGYGPIVLGVMAVLLGVLDLAKFGVPGEEEEERVTDHDERIAEILAIVPLLLFAATGVAAAIDAELSRGGWRSLQPLVPSAILAGAAVLMTAEKRPRRFRLRWRVFVPVVIVVGVGSVALLWAGPVADAVIALVVCAGLLAFIGWLFHLQPKVRKDDKTYAMLALPTAGAVGLGSLLAVHIDTFGSTIALGTLTLVVFGAAFWLAVLNALVFGSFYLKPPSVLFQVGVRQLPVLTLVVIAWFAVGAIESPPTLHEARLVNRESIVTANGHTRPATPTLKKAFAKWVDAQPELNGTTTGSSTTPVPMYLVAAHGGGIRAAYWTALALDCIVGVSNGGLDAAKLKTDADATCSTSRRRKREQQADAARRIFVASGVSGGAMGLFAYARELISDGNLGGGWVDERLGRDFAAPTVGWALFHDLTNHWFGLNSHRGGDCAWEIGSLCMTADRATILEQAFDRAWPTGRFDPRLRLTWDMRSSADAKKRMVASLIPLLITNTTVTGGKARGVVSAANLGAWPNLDAREPGRGDYDTLPLAGTVEVVEAACATKDLRLSTAALLGSRFPYVSPSGHVSGHCRLSRGDPKGAEKGCASVKASLCEMRLVDGGYADNSGLVTIDALWPSIRQLVTAFNAKGKRQIALVIVELDNHYRAPLEAELSAGGVKSESVVPLMTAFGAHSSMETFARALAYRLRPPGCTVTISPGLHPGLTAPLGWELSAGARADLREGLVRPHTTEFGDARDQSVLDLRRLQEWLGTGDEAASPGLKPSLSACIPKETSPNAP